MPDHEEALVKVLAGDLDEDRFSRLRLITWWEQERLQRANVLVIGAGALGNEILKNLALLGFRRVLVVDSDRIELSNLSRSVLFRADDVGRSKAQTAAAAAAAIADLPTYYGIDANVVSQLGLGVFGWADVIIAGLDNREARLWINRSSWKMGRPWIDGAIEGVSGVARVFLPGRAPCYECTLGETDWAILDKRMSCNLLTREEMVGGKTPTTPTTSSIIAGIEVQEAVKLLHGLPVLASRAFVFDGLHHTSYLVEYTENPACQSYVLDGELLEYPGTSAGTTLNELFAFAQERLGTDRMLALDFSRDVICQLRCPQCGVVEDCFAPVGGVSAGEGLCPSCGTMREVLTAHGFTGTEPYGGRTLRELGLPLFDVYSVRGKAEEINILIAGDREEVLGPLAPHEPTVWGQSRAAYESHGQH
jgi:molybdopterin/thiamine biosynthesis adenylyltransferase